MHRGIVLTLAGLTALTLASRAHAVDGVIEINQATAGSGLLITAPGSYRLTSDVTVPASRTAISVQASDVTLDLNGFTLRGGGGSFADGVFFATTNVEILNGTIRDFSRHGIFSNLTGKGARVVGVRVIANGFSGIELQATGNLVESCTARENGAFGIRVSDGSLVINSVARGNAGQGLLAGLSGYRSNALTENNGGNANAQVTGGVNLGGNLCGATLCP